MRLEISFRSTNATEKEKDALKDRVERKIKKVTRFLKDPVEVGLVIRGEKVGYTGELRVNGAGTETFSAKAEADDPVALIDGLIHTVERAVRRRHDRKVDANHRSAPASDGFLPTFDLSEQEDRDLETEEIQRGLGTAG